MIFFFCLFANLSDYPLFKNDQKLCCQLFWVHKICSSQISYSSLFSREGERWIHYSSPLPDCVGMNTTVKTNITITRTTRIYSYYNFYFSFCRHHHNYYHCPLPLLLLLPLLLRLISDRFIATSTTTTTTTLYYRKPS